MRDELATNYTDLAIEVHAVQALLNRFLNSLLVNGARTPVRGVSTHRRAIIINITACFLPAHPQNTAGHVIAKVGL